MSTPTPQQPSQGKIRPPVVVILGHVDHGKTSLLDTIRKTRIAERESGGITQHIGAYQAEVSGKIITFLDTPGHEAFSSIRSRGTKVADIAVLVVAAEESVKPQTKEAIGIIKSEEIPFIVAINKIDKESANPQRVRQDLAAEEVLVEDWGGNVPVVEISAKENKNIESLMEMILLVAELEELKEDLSHPCEGIIIESQLDKLRGYVASALIQKGSLEVGDWLTVGTTFGKVKSMEDFLKKPVKKAIPSQPVAITGWTSAPAIGKSFKSSHSKDEAQKIAEDNADLTPLLRFFQSSTPTYEGKKVLDVVFKTDVTSSMEALESALTAIKSDEVAVKVIGYDVGNIGEADLKIAMTSNAKVYGFRVKVDESARKIAEKTKIDVKTFDIIYELIESVRSDMASLLDPEIRVAPYGKLRILAVFKKDARAEIVGGKVTSGKAVRGAFADVTRNGTKLAKGRIAQLQSGKEDMPEVREGLEAGIKFELIEGNNFGGIAEGDILEIYQEEKVQRTI